jgi:hypothetical protein
MSKQIDGREVDLNLQFDLGNDTDRVWKLKYRLLNKKDRKLPKFKTANKLFVNNYGDLSAIFMELGTVEEDLTDIEGLLDVTPKEDSSYSEMMMTKIALSKEVRELTKQFKVAEDKIKSKFPEYVSLSDEYSKLAIIELEILVSGTDSKEFIKELKKEPSLALIAKVKLNEVYKEEIEGN